MTEKTKSIMLRLCINTPCTNMEQTELKWATFKKCKFPNLEFILKIILKIHLFVSLDLKDSRIINFLI